MNTHRLDELLLNLYACPTERERWPEVLDRVCHATGARSAVIQIVVRDGGEKSHARWLVRDSASEAASAEHDRLMADDVNPRMQTHRFFHIPRDQKVLRDRDLFTPDEVAFRDLRERLAQIHLGAFMSVGIPLPGDERLALVLHRDLDDRHDFNADDESFACALTPHLRQAIQLSGKIDAAASHAQELEAAIDRVRCGLVLCEPDGRVCWSNQAAQHVFARHDVVWTSFERLTAASAMETATLRRMIAEAARDEEALSKPHDRILVLGRDLAVAPVHVMLQPVSRATCSSGRAARARVLVMLSTPGTAPELPAALIGPLFALSPAESRLAAALCRGQTVDDYARVAGVTVGTARFQLRQVLAKTQVTRQSDLIRKVCSSVIAHALPRANCRE
jgi:DNA-binding CsgD family transcriptional regulator